MSSPTLAPQTVVLFRHNGHVNDVNLVRAVDDCLVPERLGHFRHAKNEQMVEIGFRVFRTTILSDGATGTMRSAMQCRESTPKPCDRQHDDQLAVRCSQEC